MPFIRPEVGNLLESESPADLHEALQQAIALEHATIPPYLFALYSLGESNEPAHDRLRDIVREEMLHMLLVCNLLKAVGGTPRIATPQFVPTYPAPLPGTIADGVRLPLAPYSMELVDEVFMELEKPEAPLRFPTVELALRPLTIGGFYANLKRRLLASAFDPNGVGQVSSGRFAALLPVEHQRIVDYASAERAIDFIVTQGEGTRSSPLSGPGPYAHYYRLAELSNGRALVINEAAAPDAPPKHRYHYAGELLAFDAAGIIPFRTNPRADQYAGGSPARMAVDDCNRSYSSILKLLQRTFEAEPALVNAAIGVMNTGFAMTIEALKALPPEADNTRPAPCFEFMP